MADEDDVGFGKLAVEKGFCSQAQFEEAVQLLEAIRKLGLKEDLGSVLIKRKALTAEQAHEVQRLLGQRAGITIAGYQILEKIGHGGMGVVFKARQVSLDRIVALKILSPKLSADRAFCERFLREARAVAKLSHPNIIVGIDVGHEGKYYYFAMEYVDGPTALQVIREQGPFPEERALRVAQQIARALEHAHKHGFVHRDIKPDNIMLTSRDEAKLCDLGVAKRMEGGGERHEQGTAVGTPHYIAPEQARGEQDVDIRADLYALGATLYHMTTGQTLFQGESSAAVMTQHLTGEAPHARVLQPELTEPFCRLLETLLAKNREDRYQNPSDLLADLDRALARKPVRQTLRPLAPCSMERTVRGAGQASAATGPRSPVGSPEVTTGPRKPVGASQGVLLVAAGAALAVLVGAGLWVSSLLTDSGPQSNRARTQTGDGRDGRGNGKRPAPDPSGEPAKEKPDLPAGTPGLTAAWEPLAKARQARQEKPGDYATLIGLFETAEKGAPAELLPEIRREKRVLEAAQEEAFRPALERQRKEAEAKFEAGDAAAALACLQEKPFAAELLGENTRQLLKRWRDGLEHRVVNDLYQALGDADLALAKLDPLRQKVLTLAQVYPPDGVPAPVVAVGKKVEERLAQSEALVKQAQEGAYRLALEDVLRAASSAPPTVLAKAAEVCEERKGLVAERHRTRMDGFKRDLQAAQAVFNRACDALNEKADAKQTVALHYPAGAAEASSFALLGRLASKEGAGVWVSSAKGAADSLFYAKLDDLDVLDQAGVKETTPDGQYAVGTYLFWRGRLDRAYAALWQLKGAGPLAAKASPYLAYVDECAAGLIGQIETLYKEAQNPKLGAGEKDKRRLQAKDLLEKLKRDFGGTEAYRARNRKAP